MKNLIKITLFITAIILFASCKKSTDAVHLDSGLINVTDAIIGGPTLNMMSPNSVISDRNAIGSNSYAIMPVRSGQASLSFGLPPVAATATAAAIPATIYFNQTLNIDKASNYSLFLTGTSVSAIDHVLIKENYTRNYTDSVCGVRFINLSPGSNPISVNIKGNLNGSEVNGLVYKAFDDFKQYPAKKTNSSYVFEFRDAATGNLLATFTMNTPYFHNVTLCLRGVPGANGVIQDNDF